MLLIDLAEEELNFFDGFKSRLDNMKQNMKKRKNELSYINNLDSHQETDSNIMPLEDVLKEKRDRYLKDTAIILSLFSIYLMTLLYAYDRGLYSVYKIPVNYSNIDIRRFLPILVSGIGLSVVLGFFIGSYKYDKVHKKNEYLMDRIYYAIAIVIAFLSRYITPTVWQQTILLIVCATISILLTIFLRFSFKRKKTPSDTVDKSVFHYVGEWYTHFFFKKPIVGLLVISVLLAPFWGEFVAKNKTSYEVVEINNCDYVIVSTIGDNAYIEAYDMDNGNAVIYTDKYMRISINDHIIKTIEFNKVEIK